MLLSGAWGKVIHENNLKQKISWHCPFKTSSFNYAVRHQEKILSRRRSNQKRKDFTTVRNQYQYLISATFLPLSKVPTFKTIFPLKTANKTPCLAYLHKAITSSQPAFKLGQPMYKSCHRVIFDSFLIIYKRSEGSHWSKQANRIYLPHNDRLKETFLLPMKGNGWS